jgi:chorismate synthase
MPIILKAALKPTPSIAQNQKTVNLKTGENENLSISGRHDPCIVARALPALEAAFAIGLLDLLRTEGKI